MLSSPINSQISNGHWVVTWKKNSEVYGQIFNLNGEKIRVEHKFDPSKYPSLKKIDINFFQKHSNS